MNDATIPKESSEVAIADQSETTAKLYAAMVKAQAGAQAVYKDSKNTHHGYKYASAEDVLAEARAALTSAGLACLTLSWHPVESPRFEFKNDDGSTYFAVPASNASGRIVTSRLHVHYRVVHESGEWLDFRASTPVLPDKGRPEDKAEATALTYNLGYFLRNLLCLPRVEEDTDAHARADGDAQRRPLDASAIVDRFRKAIADATTAEQLRQIGVEINAVGLTSEQIQPLREAHRKRREELGLVSETASPSKSNGTKSLAKEAVK